jgi:hypothetical protein
MKRCARLVSLALVLVAPAIGCADGDETDLSPTPSVSTPPAYAPGAPSPAPNAGMSPGETDQPITTQYELRNAMRALWTDHVVYTRFYLIEAIAGLGGADETAARLLRNQSDIGNSIKPFYGEQAGAQLTALLKEHITGAVALVEAAKAGDGAKIRSARSAWYANADEISRFLASANPHLPLDQVKHMMDEHLDQTLAEATARLTGKFDADVEAFDAIVDHILGLADTLSDAIAKQFPKRVAAKEVVARPDLHVAERKLWEDHVIWTRVFIIDVAGDTPDVPQATARLLANQDAIGASIAPFYGAAAGAKLATLLREHIAGAAALVTAAKSGDRAKFAAATSRWYANADEISAFLASLNPDFAPVKALMRRHLDQTLFEARNQLTGRYAAAIVDYDAIVHHILAMSDALSDVIAKEFPE